MTSQMTDTDFSTASRTTSSRVLRRFLPVIVFLILAFIGMVAAFLYFNPSKANEPLSILEGESAAISEAVDPDAPLAPINKPIQPVPVTQRRAQSPPPQKIGIIAGHRGFDSGAECADGLTEVEVNTGIVDKLVTRLSDQGVNVESLDEFDPALEGYVATALISIHADSCDYINDLATGFKISGSPYTDSAALTICMEQAYGKITQLPYHPYSITPDMDNYHAFREISQGVPALIIEIGFLGLDREILTNGSDTIVQGLEDGINCYLEQLP